MEITKQDLVRWKERTLALARDLSLDGDLLTILERTCVQVIPKDSGSMFFGWAQYNPPAVGVYRSNPSKYLPTALREVWNQSGMDHELIGHIYNFYTGLRYDESEARKTQVYMARTRGKDSLLWKLAAIIEPAARIFQKQKD